MRETIFSKKSALNLPNLEGCSLALKKKRHSRLKPQFSGIFARKKKNLSEIQPFLFFENFQQKYFV